MLVTNEQKDIEHRLCRRDEMIPFVNSALRPVNGVTRCEDLREYESHRRHLRPLRRLSGPESR